jgi:hypothetical protein
MTERQFNLLIEKIDLLIKINSAGFIQNLNFNEQVQILSNLGLSPKEIGDITGRTPNNVSVTLNYIKKKIKGKK